METLIVKVNEASKTAVLIEMLKSMNFVSSVDYFKNLLKTRQLFDEVNQVAKETDLSEMTMDDIIAEIKSYRAEQKLNRH